MDVSLIRDTRVFGIAGEFTSLSVLREGQEVMVRGNFNADGDFESTFVIIGNVFKVTGIVDSAVAAGQLLMTALEGEAIVGQKTVRIFEETLILLDWCNEGSAAMIQPGTRVRVVEKEVSNNLNAAIILLDVTGTITRLERDNGDQTATIQEEIGDEIKTPVTVSIPEGTPVDINGSVSPENSSIRCINRYVRVVLEKPINGEPLTPLKSKKIFLPLDQYSGRVDNIDDITRTLNITSIGFGLGDVVVPSDSGRFEARVVLIVK